MSIRRKAFIMGAVAGLAGLTLASTLALAQPPAAAAPAPARAAAPQAKPGYVTPPENSGGLYPISGEPFWKDKCAACHATGVERAPTLDLLALRSPEDVYEVITNGIMKNQAAGLTEAQKYGLVRFITGKSPTPNQQAGPDANPCKTNAALQPSGPTWNGWGNGVENLRYQPKPGFTAAQIPQLKVKWSFSYPGTKNTQPLIFGDRVYVASMGGKLYSLDAKTGCVHWRFDFGGGARASMSIGKNAASPSGYALYMGDDRMIVHAFDARSGKELWKVKVDEHKVGRITGSPTLYNDILYVPLSASEESQGNTAAYECCTFIGTVVAVSVKDGKIVWKQTTLTEKPKPTRKNSAGTQMYGPAGGAIWSSPTIDVKRGQLYVATGNNYTEIPHPASDAIVAMDLKTGAIRWINQVQANDNYMTGRINGPLGQTGPDFDFGSAPMMLKTTAGKDILITGNKSSTVYAMDPETGKTIWSNKLGIGSAGGGVEWSTTTDGKVVYAPLADPAGRGKPGLVALEIDTGKELWRYNSPSGLPCNIPSGRCSPAFSQAATTIPGAIIAGASDARLRAFEAATGKVIWEIDTAATPYQTANGVKDAPGGELDMGGPTIAGGMMFVHTGYNGSAGPNDVLLAFTVGGK